MAIYNILFTENHAGPWVKANFPEAQLPIYNTSAGTKMILSLTNGKANVYSLTGTLTAGIKGYTNNGLLTNLVSNPYPNPTNNTTRVDYTLPNGVNQGEIVFYDLQGKEIKRFKVDRTFDSLLISTTDIPAGTYYYQLQTSSQASGGKKLVVVK
jgi:hypothetical protein